MKQNSRRARRIGYTLLVITLVLALVIVGLQQSGLLRTWLVGWFGPPQVELSESFSEASGETTFDHSTFDGLLASFVDSDGFIDYAGLGQRSAELDDYIAALTEASIDELGRDERLALLINAYNAFTLRLILDHYPVDSIKDIPTAERWGAVRWQLADQTYSLNQIEHELIRPNFREPRIHFALVCAAVGCPPLRDQAYTGELLESQLEGQARYSHEHDRWLRYEAGAETIELTSLYEWYGSDFEQVAETVLDYAASYSETLAGDLASGHRPQVRFLEYDWSLNQQ